MKTDFAPACRANGERSRNDTCDCGRCGAARLRLHGAEYGRSRNPVGIGRDLSDGRMESRPSRRRSLERHRRCCGWGALPGERWPIFPLLPRIFAREKVPEGRMRAGAPGAPVLQQSRCCPTARFACSPHPALRATHAARGRRGKLQFATLNLAPMPLTLPLLRNGPLPLPASRARGVWAVLGRDMAGQRLCESDSGLRRDDR